MGTGRSHGWPTGTLWFATSSRPHRGGIAFEREERQPERRDVDVVEERGEPLLLSLPCGLPYALQQLGGDGSRPFFLHVPLQIPE